MPLSDATVAYSVMGLFSDIPDSDFSQISWVLLACKCKWDLILFSEIHHLFDLARKVAAFSISVWSMEFSD